MYHAENTKQAGNSGYLEEIRLCTGITEASFNQLAEII